jgi:hypothetical protein
MRDSYDLRVLLVHGIGSQKRGDTLLQFGEPLAASLTHWLDENAIAVHDTVLVDPPSRAPAHTQVTLTRGAEKKHVLVAESWWAESFAVPRWWPFAKWLLWSVPFVVFRATDHRLSLITTHDRLDAVGRPDSLPRILKWIGLQAVRIVKNALSVALALAFTVVVALLGVVGLVPRVRATIMSAQKLLVGYIGDSYLLLRSPGRGDAMVSQVERDLTWLEDNGTDKVAIVAHSQGAEVVRRVLARRTGPPIASLVTFGSGIAKLRAVQRLHHAGRPAGMAYLWRTGAAGLTVGLPLLALLDVISWPVAALGPLLSPVALALARRRLKEIVKDEDLPGDRLAAVAGKTKRWLDFYATSDPVPEGALPFENVPGTFPPASSIEIANRRSPLLDHTSYWQNGEAFRAPVVEELARLLEWELPQPAKARIARARRTREESTKALRASRYSIGSLAVLAFVLPRFAAEDTWDTTSRWVATKADWAAALARGKDEPWLTGDPERDLVAAAALALVALALHGTFASYWYGKANRRARDLFRRRPGSPPEQAPAATPPMPGPTPA